MDLTFRPMAREDFNEFYWACFPRDRTDSGLRSIVEREWHALCDYGESLSLVVEDRDRPKNERIVGCAQAVFVTEDFAARVRSGISPWLNALVTRLLADGLNPLLRPQEISSANSGDGLIGLMTHWMIADESYGPEECLLLSDYLLRSFAHFSRGYKLKEILVESTGEAAREEGVRAGFQVLNDYDDFYCDQPPASYARACLFNLSREEAWRSRGSLANWIFAYTPPRFSFGFNSREQRVLRWALVGADDQEIANRIDRSLWTVRKAWQSIYVRVETAAPGLLPEASGERLRKSRRGDEKRRVLLRYLGDHPEELCPVNTQKGG